MIRRRKVSGWPEPRRCYWLSFSESGTIESDLEKHGGEPMPIHDWSRKPIGLFHHFHQRWAVSICDALNADSLPEGFYALLEQYAAGFEPDILTLERKPRAGKSHEPRGGIAVSDAPPKTRFVTQASEEDIYAAKADRIAVYNPLGDVVAVIERVSPGNKNSRHAIRSFVDETLDFLAQRINVLIVDLFPPNKRDPQGIHQVVWDEIKDEPFELPPDKPLTLVSYSAGVPKRAYVEPVAVGDPLPSMPVFLDSATYVLAPLEATYLATWDTCPEPLRELILAAEN